MIRRLAVTAILGLVAACASASSTQPPASAAPGNMASHATLATPSATPIAARSAVPAPTPIALLGSLPTTPLDPAVGARLQAAIDHDVASGTRT